MRRKSPKSGSTLPEVLVATIIVALVLVTAMKNLGASVAGQSFNRQRSRAVTLAAALMAEIQQQPYRDPSGSTTIGPEAGEAVAGKRVNYDDVDDYHGWSAKPPVDVNGTAVPGGEGFTRTATVQWVQPDALNTVSLTDKLVKRVTVVIKDKSNRELVRLSNVVADVEKK